MIGKAKALCLAVGWVVSMSFVCTASYWHWFSDEMQKTKSEAMAHWSGIEGATATAMIVSAGWSLAIFVAFVEGALKSKGESR